MDVSVESDTNTVCAGVTVLLVDSDSTCLTIISKMLRTFGYQVITAKRATDAFCVIQAREYKIDLILAEASLPDMDKYELLETISDTSGIPIIRKLLSSVLFLQSFFGSVSVKHSFSDGVLFLLILSVVMSADYDRKAVVGCLFKGAMLYMVKPITMDDLKNMWQFAFVPQPENESTVDEISGVEDAPSMESATGVDERPILRKGKGKRKRSDEMQGDKEEDNDGTVIQKKPKLIWTDELHDRFLQAINVLGIKAHPKTILELMNVPGLKKVNVASHLQKYRLSLKRQQETIQKTVEIGSTLEHVASNHVLSEFDPLEVLLNFPDTQTMAVAQQQDITNCPTQENLDGYMSVPYTDCNQTGDEVTNNEGLELFQQMGNSEGVLMEENDIFNDEDYTSTLFDDFWDW
ncbi:hypothetical protein V6N13_093461 [Hibiscus sabdariffa]